MVNNNRRTKLLPKILLGQFGVSIIICVIALTAIGYAQGYRFDLQKLRLNKTGVLVLDYQPRDADMRIDGKKLCRKNPCFINLKPEKHSITITKESYLPWTLDLNVESESVNIYENIALFNSKIVPLETTDQNKISLIFTPTDILASNAKDTLHFNDYEIWVGDKLITRMSTPITKVVWYPDFAHLVYQQGSEIRIIDTNGRNDILLAALSDSQPTSFGIGSHGEELYFLDAGKYWSAKIR